MSMKKMVCLLVLVFYSLCVLIPSLQLKDMLEKQRAPTLELYWEGTNEVTKTCFDVQTDILMFFIGS